MEADFPTVFTERVETLLHQIPLFDGEMNREHGKLRVKLYVNHFHIPIPCFSSSNLLPLKNRPASHNSRLSQWREYSDG